MRDAGGTEPRWMRLVAAPWHLALATLLPFLQLASLNAHRLRPDNLVRSAVPVVAFALLLWGLLRRLLHDALRADLLASTLVFSFLSYGYFAPSHGFATAWLAGTAVFVVVLALVPVRWNVAAGVNVFFLVLVLTPVVTLVSLPHWKSRAGATRLAVESFPDFPAPPAGTRSETRDVHFIVLDRYARRPAAPRLRLRR